jgi:hypothetical protein
VKSRCSQFPDIPSSDHNWGWAEKLDLSGEPEWQRAALFLDRNSPACFGSSVHFLLHPRLLAPFLDLSQVVRTGRTTLPEEGTVSHDHPIWVEFARHMAPMVYPAALELQSWSPARAKSGFWT